MKKNTVKILATLLFVSNFSISTANAATIKKQKSNEFIGFSMDVNGKKQKSNEFIEFAMDVNGRFTIGTTGGNPEIETDNNKKMLYGHPSPRTSFTTIKVDGVNYQYNVSDQQSISEYGELGVE